jgi:hypothetical protein
MTIHVTSSTKSRRRQPNTPAVGCPRVYCSTMPSPAFTVSEADVAFNFALIFTISPTVLPSQVQLSVQLMITGVLLHSKVVRTIFWLHYPCLFHLIAVSHLCPALRRQLVVVLAHCSRAAKYNSMSEIPPGGLDGSTVQRLPLAARRGGATAKASPQALPPSSIPTRGGGSSSGSSRQPTPAFSRRGRGARIGSTYHLDDTGSGLSTQPQYAPPLSDLAFSLWTWQYNRRRRISMLNYIQRYHFNTLNYSTSEN